MADTRRPEGVIEKKGRWYYRPTSERERLERARQGLPETTPLGVAGTEEARRKWAEVSGRRESSAAEEAERGRVAEILRCFKAQGLQRKPNGKARGEKTKKDYTLSIDHVLMPRFGAMRYGRTEFDASRGQAIGTVDVQRFVRTLKDKAGRPVPVAANRHAACLSAAFRWAKSEGMTTYNPCAGVARNAEEPRSREPRPWEVECLRAIAGTLASPLMGLLMDYEAITGWRVSDVLNLDRRQCTAEGIRLKQGKRGKRQMWSWSDELRRIVREALELPGAARAARLARGDARVLQGHFPLEPIFPSRNGRPLTLSGFESNWQRLVELTNAALAECEVPLAIEDLHFHDLRSKAGDDAAAAGFDIADFLGNDRAVAERHYARREKVVLPLDELRKRKASA
jgi:site-specific recombinase XerD